MSKSDINQANLSADVIETEIGDRLSVASKTIVLDSVGSTNSWLTEQYREHLNSDGGDIRLLICAAEHQTAGRGRRGKVWHAPKRGITFSMCFTLPVGLADVGGLSLLAGSAVCEWLWQRDIGRARIKWPNDILVDDAKLVGILVEVVEHTAESTTLIVGIGLNYQLGDEQRKIDQASTDLFELCDTQPPPRSVVIGQLAAGVYQVCNEAPVTQSVARLAQNWSRYDALAGVEVQLGSADTEIVSGAAAGIDQSGGLRVKTAAGTSVMSSGDVSVRRKKLSG